MSPEGPDHADVTAELNTRLARLYPEGFQVRSQSTLPIGQDAFFEPDVFVVRPREDSSSWPTPRDVVLVVEVARASARRDRPEKAGLYAAWGARVYWIVDLNRGAVVVHTDPGPDGYANVTTIIESELALPASECTTPIDGFLPQR